MLKITIIAVTAVLFLYNTIGAAVSDSFWNNATTIIVALTALVTALVTALIKLITFLRSIKTEVKTVKDDVQEVKKSINGLLEQKSKADLALGVVQQQEEAAKEEGIANKARLELIREQDLLNRQPPQSHNTKNDVKDVKDEIVKTLENEIKKKGDEIQEVVKEKGEEIKEGIETKGDETHKVVKKIPDEVIKKLPPK